MSFVDIWKTTCIVDISKFRSVAPFMSATNTNGGVAYAFQSTHP